jgi:SAM-dependent methyltransferase
VTEIGAGTGHFTKCLAGRKLKITALEPVEEMRARAANLEGVIWKDATFENTGLADQSQSWVVSAQAFHWAQSGPALREIRRILIPQGWFTALWNADHIARELVLQKTYDLIRKNLPAYRYLDRTTPARRWSSRIVGAAPSMLQRFLGRIAARNATYYYFLGRGLQLLTTGDFKSIVYHEVEHEVPATRESYLELWQTHKWLHQITGPALFETFLSELKAYLEDNAIETISVPYVCGAWSAQVR